MTKVKTIQLRTAANGSWVPFTQAVNNQNPVCAVCGAPLWAMGKTVYCNVASPKHLEASRVVA
jgi:hypothetical protein